MSTKISDPEQSTYNLKGQTLTGVAAEIALKDEAAKTEWWPQYSYTTTAQQVTAVEVTVKLRITMPCWPHLGSAPDVDQSTWGRFLASLATHEQGHVDLVSQHFSNIEVRLVGQSPDEATRIWTETLSALQDVSDSYDRDTDHGRKQGAVIDIGPATPGDLP